MTDASAEPTGTPGLQPVRVTWVIKGLGPGGAERLLVEAARAMSGVAATTVFALRGKAHLRPDLEAAAVEVHGLDVPSLRDPRWVWRLLRAVRLSSPDVVHVHSPALAPIVRVAARARLFGWLRPHVVTTEHNAWPTYRPLTRLANRVTAGLDDVTVAVSAEVQRSIPNRHRHQVRVVRHGIDLGRIRAEMTRRCELRAELGIDPAETVVVTVANLRVQKNYPNLLAAAARTVRDDPSVRFLAVGQGPEAAAVAARHEELGLGQRFVLLGYRPDAVAVMAAADVFVLASDYEGLPVALMEALALGLPVVATAVGGVAETVTAEAGLLVPPGDSEALAAALQVVTRDPERRAELGRGAAQVGESFSAEAAAAHLGTLYRDLGRRRDRDDRDWDDPTDGSS
jgi:glycosyltransferase involved in cell wall biosynthesis